MIEPPDIACFDFKHARGGSISPLSISGPFPKRQRAGAVQDLADIPLPIEGLFEELDGLPDTGVDFHPIFHGPAGVENGAVVASAKRFPN